MPIPQEDKYLKDLLMPIHNIRGISALHKDKNRSNKSKKFYIIL